MALSAKDWATECARQELKIQTLKDDLAAMRADRDSHQREAIRLHEEVSFLESREVCGAAHENVETCGFCQRDGLIGLIQLLSHNEDIPESIRSNMLMNHRYIDAVGSQGCTCDPTRWADHAPGCKSELDEGAA